MTRSKMNMRKSSHEQVAQQERARERKARTAAAVAGAAASDGEASTQTQVAIGDKTRARSADTTLFNVHSRLEPVQGMARGSGNEDDKETGDMNEDAEDMPVDEVKFHTSGREDSESSERDLTDGVLGVNRGGHTSYEEREDTNADMSESLTSSQLAHELDLLYGDNHDESLHNYDEISFSPNSPSQEAVTTKKRTSDDRPEYETTTVDSQAKRNKLSDPSEHEMKIQGQISEQHAVEAIATKGRKKGQNEELLGDANVLITNSNIETHTSKHKDSVDSAKQSHPTSTKEAEPEKKTMKAKSVDNDEDEFENDGNKKEEEDAQNSKTAFGPLDFETMPGTPIQPFDIEALGEDYEKLTSEYDGKIRNLLDQWTNLNHKIEVWMVRGTEMQNVREQCMLRYKEGQVDEQVKLAINQRKELVRFCKHMQMAFSVFFPDTMWRARAIPSGILESQAL